MLSLNKMPKIAVEVATIKNNLRFFFKTCSEVDFSIFEKSEAFSMKSAIPKAEKIW